MSKSVSSFCFFILSLLSFPLVVSAQIDEITDEMSTMDDVESEAWEQNYDVLSELYEHPVNLNAATREELEQLPFLTAEQIEQLQE